MNIKDFEITQCNKKITDIKHKDYPLNTDYYFVDEERQLDILDKASDFVNGVNREFKVWSDYDYEEPSENIFIAFNKDSGLIYYIINEMEQLIMFLWDKNFDVYEVIIDYKE